MRPTLGYIAVKHQRKRNNLTFAGRKRSNKKYGQAWPNDVSHIRMITVFWWCSRCQLRLAAVWCTFPASSAAPASLFFESYLCSAVFSSLSAAAACSAPARTPPAKRPHRFAATAISGQGDRSLLPPPDPRPCLSEWRMRTTWSTSDLSFSPACAAPASPPTPGLQTPSFVHYGTPTRSQEAPAAANSIVCPVICSTNNVGLELTGPRNLIETKNYSSLVFPSYMNIINCLAWDNFQMHVLNLPSPLAYKTMVEFLLMTLLLTIRISIMAFLFFLS